MFNSKKIKKLESEIFDLKKENQEIKEQLEEILDLLDNKQMSQDWEEYVKYKEMKEQLPDIETMYQLKLFKKAIENIEKATVTIDDANIKKAAAIMSNTYNKKDLLAGWSFIHDNAQNKMSQSYSIIESVLENLKAQKDTDLQALFKLYAIDTKWLHP